MTSTPTLIEVAPGLFRVLRDAPDPPRSNLPMPHVISDSMPPTEHVDGKFYTSKAEFRAVGRSLGLTEVGNEKPKPKRRASDTRETKVERRRILERAIAQYRQGRRAKHDRSA